MRQKFNPEHILRLCEPGDFGILAPPMKAQVAVDELCRYLLGYDWYDTSGATNPEQINTEIVCAIEKKFPGAVVKPEHEATYMSSCGRVPLFSLPVGSTFRLGKLSMKKISDHTVISKMHKRPPNAINLENNHKCTILSSVYVIPLDDNSDLKESVEETEESTWVPTSERLPEVDEKVLVRTKDGGHDLAYFRENGCWDSDSLYYQPEDVEYWMSIPNN